MTEQVLVPALEATRLQVPLAKEPPEMLAVQVTVPVGLIAVPELVSVTVTVKVIWLPWRTDEVEGLTKVVVNLRMLRERLPWLALCAGSDGEYAAVIFTLPTALGAV
ncbi:MAG TPA: hypothetical protein VFE91_04355 [Nitrososphaerales archaeon]|nr:hypothetical protein [Nitrososphaerales archaeon]